MSAWTLNNLQILFSVCFYEWIILYFALLCAAADDRNPQLAWSSLTFQNVLLTTIFLTVRQTGVSYLCGYGSSCCMHYIIPQYSRPSTENLYFPIPPHPSAVPLRLPELCLQVSITFCFSAASIFKDLTQAAVSSEGREGWENSRKGEKRRWMGKRGVRAGKGDRGTYQDGGMKIE